MGRRIIKNVALSDIVFDLKIYPRTMVNWQTTYDYANSLKTGAKFPPITLALHNRRLILVDGKHRLDAFKQCKRKTILAEVYTGWNKKKIFIESIQRNIAHGRILSPHEKRLCIMKLREMKISNEDISNLIQIPQDKLEHFVGQRLISSTTGDVISFEVIKSGIKHIAGKTYDVTETKTILGVQKDLYVRNQLNLFDHLINLFEGNLINLKDEKIQQRINKLSELINPLIKTVE